MYVNGVDQGTGKGIRTPAYNGAPGKGGYNNGPVKDLTSIDMRCNVMGDFQASETIKVMPGDNLTFDWYALHHSCQTNVDEAGTTTTATTQTTSSPTAITVTPLSSTHNGVFLTPLRPITNLHLPRPTHALLLHQTLALGQNPPPFPPTRALVHNIRYPRALRTHEHAHPRGSQTRALPHPRRDDRPTRR